MKEKFLKTTKHLFALAFVAFVIAVSLNTTAFAANQKVTNLKQTHASTNSIGISWDAPLGADRFNIYISEQKDFPESATIIYYSYSTSFAYINNLNPNHTYYVKVIAISNSGTHYDFSDTIACVTAPESVSGMTHIKSTTSAVSVSWNAPISGTQYYKIYYMPSGTSIQKVLAGTTTNRNYTVQGLMDDTEYSVYVYPVRKSESGFEAVGSHGYISYIPTTAKASKLSSIKLSRWDAGSTSATVSLQNDTKNQSGIEIEISSLSGKKIRSIKASRYSSSISFSLSKIKNKGFKYRLRAYITAANKDWYGPYTSQKIAVAQPKVTAAKKSNTSLKLTWKKISGAKSYSVYVAKEKNDKFKKVATVKSTSYILKKTKPCKNYYIYVKANGVKSGKKSYSSTSPVYQQVDQVYYYKYSNGASNYYTTVQK